jgi:hypothetical protein
MINLKKRFKEYKKNEVSITVGKKTVWLEINGVDLVMGLEKLKDISDLYKEISKDKKNNYGK